MPSKAVPTANTIKTFTERVAVACGDGEPGEPPIGHAAGQAAGLAASLDMRVRDLGDWREAEHCALEASALSGDMARTRAFNTALLATAYAETDLERALAAGAEALDMAAGLQSGRAVRYVDDLRRRLRRRYGNEPKVRDFDEQASATLGSR